MGILSKNILLYLNATIRYSQHAHVTCVVRKLYIKRKKGFGDVTRTVILMCVVRAEMVSDENNILYYNRQYNYYCIIIIIPIF